MKYGTMRQQHQRYGGKLLIVRPVQTSPTESNTENRLYIKCNAWSVSIPFVEKVICKDINACLKGENKCQSST